MENESESDGLGEGWKMSESDGLGEGWKIRVKVTGWGKGGK